MSNMFLVIGLTLALVCSVPFAQAADNGWAISQINPYAPSGKWTITLGSEGLKAADGSISLIITAPNFDACFLNATTKQYASASHQEWIRTFLHKDSKDQSAQVKYFRDGTKTSQIAGLKVRQSFLCTKQGGKERVLREVWTTDEIKLPKKNGEVLNQLCNLPLGQGVPLRVTRIFADGNKEVALNTTEVKKIPIVVSTFKQPEGYTKAKSATAVMLSAGPGQEITDMIAAPEAH